MHGEPGIPEQVLHPDQVIGGGECPAQAAFPGVDGKDMAEIIETDGEEGIGPRCGHLGPRGGSPLKGRKTVGREKEIGGDDGGREDCGIAGGSVQSEGRTQATSGLSGRDDYQFITEIKGSVRPLTSEVFDCKGE